MAEPRVQVAIRDQEETDWLFDDIPIPRVGEGVTIYSDNDDENELVSGIVERVYYSLISGESGMTAVVILR